MKSEYNITKTNRNPMKANAIFLLLLLFMAIKPLTATSQERFYVTSNYEIIFSMPSVEYGSSDPNAVLRFAPWFNSTSEANFDFSQNFGATVGLGIRNIGFIYDVPQDQVGQGNAAGLNISSTADVRKKFRNYTIGVPMGIKVGDLNHTFLFGGYEIELPFHYKEKTFVNGDKEYKHTNWFDSRIPTFYHSAFAGIQLPGGAVFKVKYYFTDFFNQSRVQQDNWTDTRNYYPTKANVFYFSIVFRMLKNNKVYYKEYKESQHAVYSMR